MKPGLFTFNWEADMEYHDPVEVVKIEKEVGDGQDYEVSRSEKSRFLAEAFVCDLLVPPERGEDEGDSDVADVYHTLLREFLIQDFQKRLRASVS